MKQSIEELLIKKDPRNKEKLDQLRKIFAVDDDIRFGNLSDEELDDLGVTTPINSTKESSEKVNG